MTSAMTAFLRGRSVVFRLGQAQAKSAKRLEGTNNPREQTTPEVEVKKSPLYKQNEQCYILTTTGILRQSL